MRKILYIFILASFFLASCGQDKNSSDAKGFQVNLDGIEIEDKKINIDSVNAADINGEETNTSSSSFSDEIFDNNTLTGEIIEIENDIFLLDVNDEGKNIADTIWVTVEDAKKLNDLQIGQNVSIWFNMIRESYPPQTDALKIEIH
ncbi:DUF3221 domain-containing protein [Ralstonia pickettii]|nr:DUF3221 domain-containing protein [Ralstonia pickettii]